MLKRAPLHVLFFALFPVVALIASNIREVQLWVAVIPLAIVFLGACLLLGIVGLILKDWLRAGLLVSLFILLFFTYGHIYKYFENTSLLGIMIGRHRVLIPFYSALWFGGIWLCLKTKTLEGVTSILNLTAMVALLLPTYQVVRYQAAMAASPYGRPETLSYAQQPALASLDSAPDIYYIILDMYTRADVLADEFGYDNSPFLDALRQRGFTVADCSLSNYGWTRLSLASALNMNYLQDIGPEFASSQDMPPMTGLVKQNLVRNQLEKLGYQIVAFETGYTWTEWYDANYYFSPPGSSIFSHQLTLFTYNLTRRTALKIISDGMPALNIQLSRPKYPNAEHVQLVRYTLSKLKELDAIPSPKFVFAHIPVPHKPFVFAEDGSLLTDAGYVDEEGDATNQDFAHRGYVSQVKFINREVLGIVDEILENSSRPPVIIIQGDHGYYSKDRLKILNAFYLPDPSRIYPSITPVNTFRIIFNQYFQTDYPMLADQSFRSNEEEKLDFRIYQEDSPECIP